MIKGCQKRVVWLSGGEGEWFEEAYFILSEKKDKKKLSSGDMISEANRIIAESRDNSAGKDFRLAKDRGERSEIFALIRFKWLTLGSVLGGCIGLIVGYFII